jgi:hypothetical protein
VALSACSGPPPPSPTTSFRAETVALAKTVTPEACGVTRVELASGDQLDLVLAGSALNYSTPCPGSTATVARRLFGTNEAETAKTRLFLFGHDAGDQPFYAWASEDGPSGSCAAGTYLIAGGGFEDGDTFHLPSGLVLDKAAGFDRGSWKDPAVVTADAWLCVDSSGRVLGIDGPHYL